MDAEVAELEFELGKVQFKLRQARALAGEVTKEHRGAMRRDLSTKTWEPSQRAERIADLERRLAGARAEWARLRPGLEIKREGAAAFEPSAVALHEAGHAVVALALGVEVRRVLVKKDGGGLCYTETYDELRARGITARAAAFYQACMALAGGAADPEGAPSSTDVRIAKNAIASGGGGIAEWEKSEARTRALVKQNHAAIRQVALALDRRGELTGREVANMLGGKPLLDTS